MRYGRSRFPIPPTIWKSLPYFIAFGMGSGALPFAPGTWGTLMAIPFYQFISILSTRWYIIIVLCLSIGSMWLLDHISKALAIHDHPGMCLDEFIGYFVTMMAVPCTPMTIISGFLLFRLFDIWKPWPIHWLDEHAPGGFGMVIDDIVAGLYASAVLAFIWS